MSKREEINAELKVRTEDLDEAYKHDPEYSRNYALLHFLNALMAKVVHLSEQVDRLSKKLHRY